MLIAVTRPLENWGFRSPQRMVETPEPLSSTTDKVSYVWCHVTLAAMSRHFEPFLKMLAG
jgi:hypothetical protein